jgi:predicted nucleic acid-binding protein
MDSPRRIRVFLDASTLLAAAISPAGASRELLVSALVEGRLQLSLSPLVLRETSRNLAQKSPDALPYFDLLEQFLTPYQVFPSKELIESVAQNVALKDAPIVAGAVVANADFLATFDRKHLLIRTDFIRDRFGVTVATPGHVLKTVRRR